MTNIGDVFVDALTFNQGLNFTQIIACVVIYFLFFWFAVCVWVYNDAKKRYINSDPRTPFLIATGVFILFFPALVFYLAVRPRDNDLDLGGYSDGGVNVPLVNFVGKEGISMTLELNIHKTPEQIRDLNGMKIDVNWASSNNDMEVIEQQDKFEREESAFLNLIDSKRKGFVQKLKSLFKKEKSQNESNQD